MGEARDGFQHLFDLSCLVPTTATAEQVYSAFSAFFRVPFASDARRPDRQERGHLWRRIGQLLELV
jgi:hypothetical protein